MASGVFTSPYVLSPAFLQVLFLYFLGIRGLILPLSCPKVTAPFFSFSQKELVAYCFTYKKCSLFYELIYLSSLSPGLYWE